MSARSRFHPLAALLRWAGLFLAAAGLVPALLAAPAPASPETNQSLPCVELQAARLPDGNDKLPCTVRIAASEGRPAEAAGPLKAAARLHGASSRGLPKKSYNFSIETPAPLLGMSTRGQWILHAVCIDRSFMRHKLAYDLFRSLSTPGAPRPAAQSRFVEARINGSYEGVYLLMEHVDRRLLGWPASAGSNTAAQACLYKAVDHGANFGQTGHDGYAQKEPDLALGEYWTPLEALNKLSAAGSDARFFDPKTGVESLVDLDEALDFYLLVLLTSNSDGITKNYFLARPAPAPDAPARRFVFVPWDYDGTFGRNWDATPFPHDVWLSNHLFDRLMARPEIRARMAARWRQVRAREFSTAAIQHTIDTHAAALASAAARNARRWPEGRLPFPDRISFKDETARMKKWVAARAAWLDREIPGK